MRRKFNITKQRIMRNQKIYLFLNTILYLPKYYEYPVILYPLILLLSHFTLYFLIIRQNHHFKFKKKNITNLNNEILYLITLYFNSLNPKT